MGGQQLQLRENQGYRRDCLARQPQGSAGLLQRAILMVAESFLFLQTLNQFLYVMSREPIESLGMGVP